MRTNVGDGTVQLAVALKGRDAHTAWAMQQALPQRLAQLQEEVVKQQMQLTEMHELVEYYAQWAQRERHQKAEVALAATTQMEQMSQQQITWQETEAFARAVLFEQDLKIQNELKAHVEHVRTAFATEEMKRAQLQITNETCRSELQVCQQQLLNLRTIGLGSEVAELRDQVQQQPAYTLAEARCVTQLRTKYAEIEQQHAALEGNVGLLEDLSEATARKCTESVDELASRVTQQEATIAQLRILTADHESTARALPEMQAMLGNVEREMEAECESIVRRQSLEVAREQVDVAELQVEINRAAPEQVAPAPELLSH